jgi:hypothetical protein
MTRVAWRQQRPSAVAASARDSGLACVAGGGDCRVFAEAFATRYGPILEPVSALGALLPVVLGVLVGGPLLAREFEQGTHRLAWTQSVTRGRWLAARLALAAGLVAVPVVAIPLNLAAQSWLAPRPRPLPIAVPAGQPSPRAGLDDQIVRNGYRDRSGRDPSAQAVDRRCPGATGGHQAVDRCLAANGIQRTDRYQPAGRAWQLALAQSAVYLVVAALFLALACWRTLRPDEGRHRRLTPR